MQSSRISTHTSRVGCDATGYGDHEDRIKFLLTHPVWDVTYHRKSTFSYHYISTHTSRVGCDNTFLGTIRGAINFYSHIPCGMWQSRSVLHGFEISFLLTHPVWDVTKSNLHWRELQEISTHTSRVGCDSSASRYFSDHCYFYSHIPCGMWPDVEIFERFLLTHPVWDVTNSGNFDLNVLYNFYSHIPCGMWRFRRVWQRP